MDSNPIAVVIGGGPSGALTAKVLSEQGFNVQLYEAYPHPGSDISPIKSKAYVISINPRGQLALKRCGVDPLSDLDAAVFSEAVVRHNSSNGKATVIRHNDGTHRSVMLRRRDLAASLLRAAEKSGVEVHCEWRLKDVNFEKRQVTVAKGTANDTADEEKVVSYDLLVGADGVRSRVRTLLSNHLNEQGEEWNVKTVDDTMEYQVAVIPRPWKDIVLKEQVDTLPLNTCPPASLHAWADKELGGTALGFPMRDSNQSPIDKFLVCVIYPGGMLEKMKESGLSGYTSALSAIFSNWTADSRLDLAQLLAEEDNCPSTGGICVWPQALSHPDNGVVLMGDAGHGMWPSLGQGCNAALESVSAFADAIDSVKGSVSSGAGCRGIDFSTASNKELSHAIALEFDGIRQDDAMAAVDLTYGGIGGTKVRGSRHSPLIFKFQVMLFIFLNKVTAGLVPLPAMMRIMKGDTARYSTLKWANKVESVVVHGMLGTLLGITCLGLSRLF